jgi:hypothetical protein
MTRAIESNRRQVRVMRIFLTKGVGGGSAIVADIPYIMGLCDITRLMVEK